MTLFQKKAGNVQSVESLPKVSLFGDQADLLSMILLEKVNLPSIENVYDRSDTIAVLQVFPDGDD